MIKRKSKIIIRQKHKYSIRILFIYTYKNQIYFSPIQLVDTSLMFPHRKPGESFVVAQGAYETLDFEVHGPDVMLQRR